MKCFIIMPFGTEFDDVYTTIKLAIMDRNSAKPIQCTRIDDVAPAGRITGRLLLALSSCDLCISDLTGTRPNVMWETGYAMALEKPVVIITQNLKDLPFDLHDMQALEYDRKHLSKSLTRPLKKAIDDTINFYHSQNGKANSIKKEITITKLEEQIVELKTIVLQAIKHPEKTAEEATNKSKSVETPGIENLEGAWIHEESKTHLYAKVVNGVLLAPYCYGGNDKLTAYYYDWRKVGDYWFARYRWFNCFLSGFAFLRQESANVIIGSWWDDNLESKLPDISNDLPPKESGFIFKWVRGKSSKFPNWAEDFFDDFTRNGQVAWSRSTR